MSTVSLNCNDCRLFTPSSLNHFPAISSSDDIANKIFKNSFFWALGLAVGGAIVMISAAILLNPPGALAVSALVLSILSIGLFSRSKETKKWLFCEYSMMLNQLLSRFPSLTKRPWFSPITDKLTLAACPLFEHVESLKAEGYSAVLSLLESSETERHLFGCPAKPKDWQAANIDFLNLPTPDCTAVLDENVEKGVAFLHHHISRGRKVIVNCLAGVGRSATIVICYLVKHQGMSAKEAVAFVRSKRAIAVGEKSPAIRSYVERVTASQF